MSATHRCAPCGALYLNWVSYCDFCNSPEVKELASSGISPAGFVLVPRKPVRATGETVKPTQPEYAARG